MKRDSLAQIARYMERAREMEAETGAEDALRELLEEYLAQGEEPARQKLRRAYFSGAVPLAGPYGARRILGAIDMGFFGRAYLPQYFSRRSPAFHAELDRVWQESVMKGRIPLNVRASREIDGLPGCRRATAAPRGHAKSTNITFKGSLHATLYGYKHFILLLSDVADQAVGFLEAIREEIEENEAIREDFGELAGDVWRENVLVTSTGVKLAAKGAGQKVRGLKHRQWRPDLIILDDIENDENVRTPEQRSKLENWYTKAVSKCGDSYTDIYYVGTLLHYDSLLAKVLRNPGYESVKYRAVLSPATATELWDTWAGIYTDLANPKRMADARAYYDAHQAAMDAGAEVLWPEKFSYYDIMEQRITDGEAAYNSELQNEPINPEDCLFNEEWFAYFDMQALGLGKKDFHFYGFVDPSLGRSKKSDYSAIVTVARHRETGYMYVLDADIERRHPDRIIEDVLQKALWLKRDFGAAYTVFGCETNQFQWFLKEQMAKESARRGVYLPLKEVRQSSDKTLRIQGLQPYVKNGYVKFQKNQKRLLEQLKYFPMADHDDGPDALEGCVNLAAGKAGRRLSGIRGI